PSPRELTHHRKNRLNPRPRPVLRFRDEMSHEMSDAPEGPRLRETTAAWPVASGIRITSSLSSKFSSRDAKMSKYVYFFGGKWADGNGKMKDLLGAKGANLAEMCLIGLPVPAGFTITTEVCNLYYANGKKYPDGLKAEVEAALKKTEEVMGAKFGDPKKPLLVSCRSGARVSMPAMMDTALSIALNEST